MGIPLLIPLGNGSQHNNDELRFLLRSVEKNLGGISTIYLMTSFKPDWIVEDNGLVVEPLPDKYTDDKDANLIFKTNETIRKHNIGKFVWCADDNVFLKPINADEIPIIHNHRDNSVFYKETLTKWQHRVRNTLEWAKSIGVNLPHNYECHCPQTFEGQKILENMVEYYPNQKTIYTLYRVVTNTWQGSKDQRVFKHTFELPMDESVTQITDGELMAKPFMGYNDQCVDRVLARLKQLFPNKSKWEK